MTLMRVGHGYGGSAVVGAYKSGYFYYCITTFQRFLKIEASKIISKTFPYFLLVSVGGLFDGWGTGVNTLKAYNNAVAL